MPRQVFGGEVEASLIHLRGEHVRTKSGTTQKRSVKEKEVAEALTTYLRQLGEMESVFTSSVVHSTINKFENEGNKRYRKWRQLVVLLQFGDPSEDRNKLQPLTINLQSKILSSLSALLISFSFQYRARSSFDFRVRAA